MKTSFIISAPLLILGVQALPAPSWSTSLLPTHWKHPLRAPSPAAIFKRTPKDEDEDEDEDEVDTTAFWPTRFPKLVHRPLVNTTSDKADANQRKPTSLNRLSKRQGYGSTKIFEGWEHADQLIRELAYQYGLSLDLIGKMSSWEESVWEHDRHPFESNLWGFKKEEYDFINKWKPTSYFPDSEPYKKFDNPLAPKGHCGMGG